MGKFSNLSSVIIILAIVASIPFMKTVKASSPSDFIINNGVLIKYTGTDADVTIPDGITEIGQGALTSTGTQT